MKRKLMLSAGLVAGALMLSGCGGGGNTTPDTSSFSQKLIGSWKAKGNSENKEFCINEAKSGKSYEITRTFSADNTYTKLLTSYREYDCTNNDLEFQVEFSNTYKIGKELTRDSGSLKAYEMDSTLGNYTVLKGEAPAEYKAKWDKKQTAYYSVLIDIDNHLRFSTKVSTNKNDRPTNFNFNDQNYMVKQ